MQAVQRAGVEFDMFSKVVVKGEGQCDLYKLLTGKETSPFPGPVSWNFEKFLVDPQGNLVGRWRSYVTPTSRSLQRALEKALPTSSQTSCSK